MANPEQKVKVIGERNLASSLPLFRPFDTPTTTTVFDMGITRATSNLVPSKVKAYQSRLVTTAQRVTLEDLRINSLEKARTIRQYSDKIFLRPDRTDFTSYSYFGSLVELLRVNINQIIKTWPGSLYVNPDIESVYTGDADAPKLATVLNIKYDSVLNATTFQIPTITCVNNFTLNLLQTNTLYETNDLRNLAQEYSRYSVGYMDTEYPIIGFTGLTTTTAQFLNVQVSGNIFADATVKTAIAREFHIQPSGNEIGLYLKGLNSLSAYLLNVGSNPRFTALFRYPGVEDDDIVEQYVTWPCSDGFNPDFTGGSFGDYQELLFALAQTYDTYKTNLLIRRLVPSSLLDMDKTYSGKMSQLLQAYSREFDKIKAFIDGLAYINTVTYDRLNNAPDALIMNLARTLGWDTFPIASDETDVINALFNPSVKNDGESISPAEVDTELWRRITLNSTWLLQSKGTRQSIEAILALVGAPQELVEFNEYIYLAEKDTRVRLVTDVVSLTTDTFNQETTIFSERRSNITADFISFRTPDTVSLSDSLIAEEITPLSDLDLNGNFVSKDFSGLSIIEESYQIPERSLIIGEPTNLEFPQPPLYVPFQNIGNTVDADYMETVANQGFILKKVVDNKKSWASASGVTRQHARTETSYQQGDSRMVVNSKEASITLNPAKAVEFDVYNYVRQTGFPIGNQLAAPYPVTPTQLNLDVDTIGFFEFVKEVYERFVDVRNRKTIRAYPTLQRIYLDYLHNNQEIQSSALTTANVLNFVNKISASWNRLIEQMIPATTIITESGLLLRNTVFERQKFVYKGGIDAGSEFQTVQPPNVQNDIILVHTEGSVDEGVSDQVHLVELSSSAVGSSENTIDTRAFSAFSTKMGVKTTAKASLYSFTPPNFTATGVNKIITGATASANTYYYDDNKAKKFTVNFTAANAGAIRGPLGADVGVLLFPYLPDKGMFSSTPVHRQILDRSQFSEPIIGPSLTGPITLSGSVLNSAITSDTEYLMKVFFVKKALIANNALPEKPIAPLSYYDDFVTRRYPEQYRYSSRFYDRTKPTAISAVTFSSEPSIDFRGLGLPYGTYDPNKDFYFTTLGKPEKPRPLFSSKSLVSDYTEYVVGNTSSQITTFALTCRLAGLIDVYKNGLLLGYNVDYVPTPGFLGTAFGNHYTLLKPLKPEDVLRIVYPTFQDKITTIITGVTTTATGITGGNQNTSLASPWYNTTTKQIEMILPSVPQLPSLSIEYEGKVYTSPELTVATSSTSTTAFALPSTAPTPALSGSTLTARYLPVISTSIEAEPLLNQPTTIDFEVSQGAPDEGYFEIDITGEYDLLFEDMIISARIPYVKTQRYFRFTLDLKVVSGITPNKKYLIRIKSHKDFITLNGMKLPTDSLYDIYRIRLGNLIASPYNTTSSATSDTSIGMATLIIPPSRITISEQ